MTEPHKKPSPLELDFWISNRVRILGSLALLAAVLVLFLFLRERSRATEAQGWAALVDPATGALRTDIDLASVRGTSAEPWALFHLARSVFDQSDRTVEALEQALDRAEELRASFPNHPLVTSGKVDALVEDLRAEIAFLREHPFPRSNPPPSEDHWLLLRTALGPIRICFYPEQAPVGMRWAAEWAQADSLKPLALAERVGNGLRLVPKEDKGQKDGSSDQEKVSFREVMVLGRVPDRNLLSHYAGAVGFARFEDMEEVPEPQVPRLTLYAHDEPFQDDNEVVIGMVTEGLGILEQVSSRALAEGGIRLEEPLAIEAIEVSTALQSLASPNAPSEESPSEGSADEG